MYGIRRGPNDYSSGCVDGLWSPDKPPLITPRTFCLSPFPEEQDVIYMGGFDSNFKQSSDCAWIYKVDFATALGYK